MFARYFDVDAILEAEEAADAILSPMTYYLRPSPEDEDQKLRRFTENVYEILMHFMNCIDVGMKKMCLISLGKFCYFSLLNDFVEGQLCSRRADLMRRPAVRSLFARFLEMKDPRLTDLALGCLQNLLLFIRAEESKLKKNNLLCESFFCVDANDCCRGRREGR